MALANFFSRAEQSLQHVLRSVNSDTLIKHVQSKSVALVFDEESLNYDNSKIMIELAVNMLSRLYPLLGIVYTGNDTKGIKVISEVCELAYSINPKIEITHENKHFDVVLCLGEPNCNAFSKVYIGASSWNLEVKTNGPTKLLKGNIYNPFSAAAAVCFGVSEIFKIIFADLLNNPKPQNIQLSLLDYTNNMHTNNEIPEIICEDLTFVGVGAVGNATLWCLKHLAKIRGKITLIDPETVELSNLQRYILTDQSSVNLVKVEHAKKFLEREGLSIYSVQQALGEHIHTSNHDCKFNLMAVSVDNAENRIAAQAVLPKIIFNGWTGIKGTLGVSRHQLNHPTNACLACLYLSTEKVKSRTEEIADIVGLDLQQVNEMVLRNIPLTVETLKEIQQVKDYPMEVLNLFINKTLNDFYTEFVCGGLLLKFGSEEQKEEAIVPLVHQSVLAGVLLACEIVKELAGLIPQQDTVEKRLNVLIDFPDFIGHYSKKNTRVKCICCDNDYLEVYRSKYSDNL